MPRLVSARGEVGQEGGVAGGQLPVEPDGFLGRGQGVLAAPQLAVTDAEVAQRGGEVGQEGAGCRRPAPGRAGRLPRWGPGRPGGAPARCSGCRGCSARWRGRGGRRGLAAASSRRSWTASSVGGQRLLAAPQLAVAVAEVVQRVARSGRKAGLAAASSPAELDGFLGPGPGPPAGGPPRCRRRRGCSARWRGRGGRRGCRPASSRRSWTASSAGARASWRRPTSL